MEEYRVLGFVFLMIMTKLGRERRRKKKNCHSCNGKIRRTREGEVRYAGGMRRLSICSQFQQSLGVGLRRSFCRVENGLLLFACLSRGSPRCDTRFVYLPVINLFCCAMATELLFEFSFMCRRIQWKSKAVPPPWK